LHFVYKDAKTEILSFMITTQSPVITYILKSDNSD